MKSKTHHLCEELTAAIGPILRENPDYTTILQAMALVAARVIQSTPDVGKEVEVLDQFHDYMAHALNEFLKIEADLNAKQEKLKAAALVGIDGFSSFGKLNGTATGHQIVLDPHLQKEAPVEEPDSEVVRTDGEHTAGDYPSAEPQATQKASQGESVDSAPKEP